MLTNFQRFRVIRYFVYTILLGLAYTLGTIVGFSDGYEAGLRHGSEMK